MWLITLKHYSVQSVHVLNVYLLKVIDPPLGLSQEGLQLDHPIPQHFVLLDSLA